MERIRYQRNLGLHDPNQQMPVGRSATKFKTATGKVDPAIKAIAKQLADVKLALAKLPGRSHLPRMNS